jgi:hypothetical protein
MFIHTLPKPVLVYPGRIPVNLDVCTLTEHSWDNPILERVPDGSIIDCTGMGPCTGLVIKKDGEYFGYHRADGGKVLDEDDVRVLGNVDYTGLPALITGKNPFKTHAKEVDGDLLDDCKTKRAAAVSKLEALKFNVISGFSDPPVLESSSHLVVNTINGSFAIVQQNQNRRPYLISLGSFDNPEPVDLKTATEDALTLAKFVD